MILLHTAATSDDHDSGTATLSLSLPFSAAHDVILILVGHGR